MYTSTLHTTPGLRPTPANGICLMRAVNLYVRPPHPILVAMRSLKLWLRGEKSPRLDSQCWSLIFDILMIQGAQYESPPAVRTTSAPYL
ncbi:hypothetical protein MHYP_G00207770 [Metynnis hypsauchen]